MAFLTILTRSFRRPESLGRCVNSVALQTDPDIEHLIVHDAIGRGVEWSYTNLSGIVPDGQYVMLLDDDNYLDDRHFIEKLKRIADVENCPEVIFIDMQRLGDRLPDFSEGVKRGFIDAACFVVRRDVWLEHAPRLKSDYSADFYFIDEIVRCERRHTTAHLHDIITIMDRVSHGQPENLYTTA